MPGIVINSGRDRETLEKWFKQVNVDIAAEHGIWIRKGLEWEKAIDIDDTWKSEVLSIVETLFENIESVEINDTDYSIQVYVTSKWHPYSNHSLTEQLRDRIDTLRSLLTGNPDVRIIESARRLEIKSAVVGKGRATLNWLRFNSLNNKSDSDDDESPYDFILAMGDDYTDEDTFRELPNDAITVKMIIAAFCPVDSQSIVQSPAFVQIDCRSGCFTPTNGCPGFVHSSTHGIAVNEHRRWVVSASAQKPIMQMWMLDSNTSLGDIELKRSSADMIVRSDEVINQIVMPNNADNQWIATVSECAFRVWHLSTSIIFPEVCDKSLAICRICFAGFDRLIVTGHSDGTINTWDILDIFNRSLDIKPCKSLRVHSDAIVDMVACNGTMPFFMWTCASDFTCKLINLVSHTIITICEFTSQPTVLCNSISGLDLWIGRSDGLIELRKFSTTPGSTVRFDPSNLILPKLHNGLITCLSLSYSGEQLASGGVDKTIAIWDVNMKLCIRVISLSGLITNLIFCRDDSTKSTRRFEPPALFSSKQDMSMNSNDVKASQNKLILRLSLSQNLHSSTAKYKAHCVSSTQMLRIDSDPAKLVALSCFCNFINAADRAIFPLAIIPMSSTFGWSLSYQGWLFSGFSLGYIVSQLLTDKVLKIVGASRLLFWALLMWSLIFTAIPMAAFYQEATSIKSSSLIYTLTSPVFLARLLLGLGEGFALPTIYQLYAHNLPVNMKARAFGYLSASASIGQTLAAIITPHFPWDWLFYFFGFAGLMLSLVLMRSGLRLRDKIHSSNYSLLPSPVISAKTRRGGELCKYLKSWSSWAIYIAHFSMNYSSYIIAVWFPTILTRHFRANTTLLSLTALPFILNSICGVGVGHFADFLVSNHHLSQLSMRRTMTFIGLFFPGVLLLIFTAVQGMAFAIMLISISMGLLSFNSVGHLSNHIDIAPLNAGLSFAISNTIASIPAILAGPLSANLVLAAHGSWYPVFVLAAAVNLFGAMIYITKSGTDPI